MDEFLDTLKHCSREGRREVLKQIFREIAEIQRKLERDLLEAREDFDRAVWLYSVGSADENSVEIFKDMVKSGESTVTEFLCFLHEFKNNPREWLQEYRDKNWVAGQARVARAALDDAKGVRVAPEAQARREKSGGRPATKRMAVKERMLADIRSGMITPEGLAHMAPKTLAAAYKAHRDVLATAREQVFNELSGNSVLEFPQGKIPGKSGS